MNSHKTKLRTEEILTVLRETERVDIAELAERLNVSRETIRRDARVLEENGTYRVVAAGPTTFLRKCTSVRAPDSQCSWASPSAGDTNTLSS